MPAREALFAVDTDGSSAASAGLEAECDLGYRGAIPRALGVELCRKTGPEQDDTDGGVGQAELEGEGLDVVGAGEEFASVHSPEALQAEILAVSKRRRHAWPAISVTMLLLLGLRKVRVEFAKRVDAWVCAANVIARPLPEPAAEEAQPHPQRRDALASWMDSAAGHAVLCELRWQLPTLETLVARVAREVPSTRNAGAAMIAARVQSRGVPVREGDYASWGPGRLSWDQARAGLEVLCTCQLILPQAALQACHSCGGARIQPIAEDEVPDRCRWCRRGGGRACVGCRRYYHYRPECAFNRGAHRLYERRPHETQALCPDCAWMWVSMLQGSPVRRAVPLRDENLLQHLRASVVAIAQPGREAEPGEPVAGRPARRLRRYVLRRLRAEGVSLSLAELVRGGVELFGCPAATEAQVGEWLREVARNLCGSGAVVRTSVEGAPALHLAGGVAL